MNERRRTVPNLGPMVTATHRPEPSKPRALEGPKPAPEPSTEPDSPNPRAPRYNLTVRLSADERDRLRAIGRAVGRPDPLPLAETIRWLIKQWRP
jgi:hypothetical protein